MRLSRAPPDIAPLPSQVLRGARDFAQPGARERGARGPHLHERVGEQVEVALVAEVLDGPLVLARQRVEEDVRRWHEVIALTPFEDPELARLALLGRGCDARGEV